MTYFLKQTEAPPQIPANNPQADIPTFWGGIGAAASKAALENDANFRLSRETAWVKDGLAADVADRVGLDAVIQHVQESGPGFDHIRKAPTTTEDLFSQYPGEATGWVLDVARQMAEEDPAAWADVTLTDDAVQAEVDRRLQAEHAEATQVLDMLPEGQRGIAELAGGMAGITADVKNLPFMFMGGGGSFLRVMGREAMINMAAETAFLPSQYKMAERLDIPDPDVAQQLMMAAGAGAAFGLGGEAIGRAWRYLTGRNRLPAGSTGRSGPETAAMMDRAEDILSGTSSDPLGDVADMVRRADRPRTFQEDFAAPAPRTDAAVYPTLREAPQIAQDAAILADRGFTPASTPDVPDGMVRMYHGGNAADAGGERWFTSSVDNAMGWSEQRGGAGIDEVFYVDVPRSDRMFEADYPDQTVDQGVTVQKQFDPSEYGGAKVFARKQSESMATAEGLGTNVARDPNFQQAGPRSQIDEVLDRQRAPQQEPDQPAPQQGTAPQARGATGAQAAPQAQPIAAPVDTGPAPDIGPVKPEKRPAGYVDQLSSRGAEPFSDPLSPEARVLHDQIEADLRTAIEGDPDLKKVDMGDGRGERSVADVLDDLDRAEDFAATIDLCGRKA